MAFEAIVLVVVFGFLIVFGSVKEKIQRLTGMQDGKWPLFLSTIGFFVGLFLLVLAVWAAMIPKTQ